MADDARMGNGTGMLVRARSVLVVIDVQERYIPHLHEGARVVEATRRLIVAAEHVGVPILLTEQYPKGIGHTVPELAKALPANVTPIEKQSMSCLGQPRFVAALHETRRSQVVIAGIEAHACVNQTVHDLLAAGHEVHLAVDAISSRFPLDYEVAMRRLVRAGAVETTVESVLLEWVRTSESPEFQAVRALMRDPLPRDETRSPQARERTTHSS